MNNTLEKTFDKLIQDWDNNPRDFMNKAFRERYKPYKSAYKSKNNPVGPKKMMEMLRKAGYEIIVVKKDQTNKEPDQIILYGKL